MRATVPPAHERLFAVASGFGSKIPVQDTRDETVKAAVAGPGDKLRPGPVAGLAMDRNPDVTPPPRHSTETDDRQRRDQRLGGGAADQAARYSISGVGRSMR
ncbi:hypothetical protein NBRC116599_40620 [Aquicoccus sp. SU-CL01552]